MKKLTLGLTVAALALTGTAYAAQGPASRDGELRRNAVTTVADVQERAARRFQRLDVNHDGRIDQADRAERRTGRLQMRFDRLDADRNGELSRTEFAARPAMREGRDGAEARRGPGMRRPAMRGNRQGMIRRADLDRNGVITQSEFSAQAVQRFERMDGDRDGRVTREERQSARAQMRERRQERRENRGMRRAAPPAAE
jgi:Ca2+-binding EF-hand superfamily protein